MNRLVILAALAVMCATVNASAGVSEKRTPTQLTFTVRLVRLFTIGVSGGHVGGSPRHATSELRLVASGTNPFHRPSETVLGLTSIHWLVRYSCGGLPPDCLPYADDFNALTQLPGGTLTASAKNDPMTLMITSGTGRFAGATGVIAWGVDNKPVAVFQITVLG